MYPPPSKKKKILDPLQKYIFGPPDFFQPATKKAYDPSQKKNLDPLQFFFTAPPQKNVNDASVHIG